MTCAQCDVLHQEFDSVPAFCLHPISIAQEFTYLFSRLGCEVCEMSPLVNLMSYACLFDHLKSLNFTSAHWLVYSSKKIYDRAKWGSVKSGLITHDRKLNFFVVAKTQHVTKFHWSGLEWPASAGCLFLVHVWVVMVLDLVTRLGAVCDCTVLWHRTKTSVSLTIIWTLYVL